MLLSDYQCLLRDADAAIEWLEEEDDRQRRRILYAAIMGLLYSISDVMDRDKSKKVRKAIQDARLRWKGEKDNRSFNWYYHFIRPERTRVVHEGKQSHSEETQRFFVFPLTDEVVDLDRDFSDIYWPLEVDSLNDPLSCFSGEDIRDLLAGALRWWKAELKLMGLPA